MTATREQLHLTPARWCHHLWCGEHREIVVNGAGEARVYLPGSGEELPALDEGSELEWCAPCVELATSGAFPADPGPRQPPARRRVRRVGPGPRGRRRRVKSALVEMLVVEAMSQFYESGPDLNWSGGFKGLLDDLRDLSSMDLEDAWQAFGRKP